MNRAEPSPALIAFMVGVAFLSGSLMFSLWLARAAAGKDLRAVGDGNPGSTNALKAGGLRVGSAAFALDMLKGAIPVGIAKWLLGFDGAALVLVSLAPIVGHAFSPFVGGRGGKAMAVSAGVWAALTAWELPILGGISLLIWFNVVRESGWAVVFLFGGILIYLAFIRPNPTLLALAMGNLLIVAWKYRADLRHLPTLRPRVLRLIGRAPEAVPPDRA